MLAAALATLSLLSARPAAADIPPTALTIPDGYNSARAFAVNSAGVVLGRAEITDSYGYVGATMACIWRNGTPTLLEPLPGYFATDARAINSSGAVVGCCTNYDGIYRALKWSPDTYAPEDLGTLEGDISADAFAINDEGQILSQSWLDYSGQRWFFLSMARRGWSFIGLNPGRTNLPKNRPWFERYSGVQRCSLWNPATTWSRRNIH